MGHVTDQVGVAWCQNLSLGSLTQTLHWSYCALPSLRSCRPGQLVGIPREHARGLGV